jgi:tripartite-type tricarboxylate transporter receptor subunit TctC
MELLKLELGMNIVHVPYKTAAGALNDVVGGHVQATIAAVQTAHPQVTTGQLRALAVLSTARSKAFVEVPTLREQGLAAGLEVETWYGAFAPAGTPAEVVARINRDVDSLLSDAGIRELLARQGMTAAGGPPERLGDLVKRELERWSRVVKAAGIKAD